MRSFSRLCMLVSFYQGKEIFKIYLFKLCIYSTTFIDWRTGHMTNKQTQKKTKPTRKSMLKTESTATTPR